jgi:cold-inducible RNA-binding protein
MQGMNGKRLYVGNLPDEVRLDALRTRFAAHGNVVDVYVATDRASGHSLRYAFVTMASAAEARSATAALDGQMFEGKPLRVNEAGANRDEEGGSRGRARDEAKRDKGVVITSQFREAHNMSYELDCKGATLVIRVFPIDQAEEAWRLEATIRGENAVAIMSGECKTRSLALEEIIRSWPQQSAPIDWPAVVTAMAGVRAI